MNPARTPPLRRPATVAVAVALAFAAGAAHACELDGLSHGYGPVSSLFAGMHRGPALDGREDKPPPEMPPIEFAPAPADSPAKARAAGATERPAPAPPRSFAPWVKARPAADEVARPALPAVAPAPVPAPRPPEGRPAA